MNETYYDVVIVGGGPGGLAAAQGAKEAGASSVLVLEREDQVGGILHQCIHDGFGLIRYRETLTGPEYAHRAQGEALAAGAHLRTGAMVTRLTPDRRLTAVTRQGLLHCQAGAVVLATGCRERTRGAIAIPGTRPAGVYTAGTAQNLMNTKNLMVGRRVVVLGSGDIGLIMARRLTLEGAHVRAVFEIQPYSSGLPRNIEQCLRDYDIPLYLSHTVTDILGKERLEGVVVSQVDEHLQPIPGTEKTYACDTLILSVGLIPENELSLGAGVVLDNRSKGAIVDESYQTSVEGIFAAGNVLHVHDLVDFVSGEAERLADAAAAYIEEGSLPSCALDVVTDGNVTHTIPQRISGTKSFLLSLRVRRPMKDCEIQICQGGQIIKRRKFKKAIPAEMIQIPVDKASLNSTENLEVKVVC